MLSKPVVCGVVTGNDTAAIKEASPLVDVFELRIDLAGQGWREIIPALDKPWIATNRAAAEGGKWPGSDARRKAELIDACELGACMADIELSSENIESIVAMIKKRAKCLISYHNFEETPPFDVLKDVVDKMKDVGADACKIVTTANCVNDLITLMRLLSTYKKVQLTAFAMGEFGALSRVYFPIKSGGIVYASIKDGCESAPGQFTVSEWRELYRLVSGDNC